MVAQQLIEIFYCQYERQQVGVLFVLAFVTAYLVSNFSEGRFLVNRELFWIFFLALPISMLRQINLVSDDISSDDADPEVKRPAAPSAYSAVPGKPWLGPLPGAVSNPAMSGVTRKTVFPHLPGTPKTPTVATPWSEYIESANDDVSSIQDDIIDLRESKDHDELFYNDTLDIDRYDKSIKSADENWVDNPMVEEEK